MQYNNVRYSTLLDKPCLCGPGMEDVGALRILFFKFVIKFRIHFNI